VNFVVPNPKCVVLSGYISDSFLACGVNQYCSRIHRSLRLGDKANLGIGLSYRHGRAGYLAGEPGRQPYAGVDLIPQSGFYEFRYKEITAKSETVGYKE
jgi:hypothetical protein